MEYLRLFISVNLPRELIDKISDIQKEFSSFSQSVKWVKPEDVHITLKFLGPTSIDKISLVAGTIKDISKNHKSFSVDVKGLGCFPTLKSPRVIWMGIVKGINFLKEIADDIDNEMLKFGFPKEEREFKPHLTIGRVKALKDRRSLTNRIEKFSDLEFGSIQVKYIFLIQSQLNKGGPKYTVLYKYMLGAN